MTLGLTPGTERDAPRRSDAGVVRLTGRDIAGLLLCGEHYAAPYDLLAAALDVRPARLRGITARWRHAGFAATGTLGLGPAWCWLTSAGMAACGLGYPARPALGGDVRRRCRRVRLPAPAADQARGALTGTPPLAVDPPLRILGIVSSPRGLPRLDVAKEKEQLASALSRLTADELAELVWAPGK